MDTIEKIFAVFQGGNDRVVDHGDFIDLLADIFDTQSYQQVQLPSLTPQLDRTYSENQSFWKEALQGKLFESMRVHLQGFHLLEWIPSAPGRYFTTEAEDSRRHAQDYLLHGKRQTYLPLGKSYMILGGVGSIRLSAKTISSQTIYFLGASSTGISHQGIPVALPESEYRKVIHIIKSTGGCVTNIVGVLRILPTDVSKIQYDRRIPKYYLFVEEVTVIKPSLEEDILTTVAITFPSSYNSYFYRDNVLTSERGFSTYLEKSWSFCSFNGASQDKISLAVDWLLDYAVRYSRMTNPPILSDFDEYYQHFDNPVEFPISQIVRNNFDSKLLAAYSDHYRFVFVKEFNMTVFDQRGQNVNYQYNAAGNINFGAVQNRADLVAELEKLKSELSTAAQAQIIDVETVTDADYQLTKAIQKAKKPDADQKTILEHINSARTMIEGVTAASGLVAGLVKAAELIQKFF